MQDIDSILELLNDRQREAVISPPGPLLVTAGAGSGKTSVLIHRIAWLIAQYGISPNRIIAVTFTNKAAREMKERIQALIGDSPLQPQIGTFHGLCNQFLRRRHEEAGLDRDFEIMDQADQLALIKSILKDEKEKNGGLRLQVKDKVAQQRINRWKEEKLRAGQLDLTRANYRDLESAEVYKLYEKKCEDNGVLDFTELILRTLEVMKRNQMVRERIQDFYQHLLVDEFQDTNPLQFDWIKLFAGQHCNVTAVGDEDQSIYSWRGALAEHMMQFKHTFPKTKVIRLEQNYRCTQPILNAANAVIKNNSNRFEKTLWTDRKGGNPIKLFEATSAEAEARYVVDNIKRLKNAGLRMTDFAVLYRTNAQSRVFEEVFTYERLPFRLYGGLRFYARKEVKETLAYLRLLINPNSNDAFSRVINMPPRGIGPAAQQKVADRAFANNSSLWYAAVELATDTDGSKKLSSALSQFVNLIYSLQTEIEDKGISISQVIEAVIVRSKLKEHYQAESTRLEHDRVENLEEMVNAGAKFEENHAFDNLRQAITAYLDSVTLDAGDTHENELADCVQIMTLHLAKGLEFPVVFLSGLDEMLLPHYLSVMQDSEYRSADYTALEEERRLFYVGMTRAKQELHLTRSNSRMLHGKTQRFRRSRFLDEIPDGLIKRKIDKRINFKPPRVKIDDDLDIKIGSTVSHVKFGYGTVAKIEKDPNDIYVTVNFYDCGEKTLIHAQANLKPAD